MCSPCTQPHHPPHRRRARSSLRSAAAAHAGQTDGRMDGARGSRWLAQLRADREIRRASDKKSAHDWSDRDGLITFAQEYGDELSTVIVMCDCCCCCCDRIFAFYGHERNCVGHGVLRIVRKLTSAPPVHQLRVVACGGRRTWHSAKVWTTFHLPSTID